MWYSDNDNFGFGSTNAQPHATSKKSVSTIAEGQWVFSTEEDSAPLSTFAPVCGSASSAHTGKSNGINNNFTNSKNSDPGSENGDKRFFFHALGVQTPSGTLIRL